MNAVAIEGAGLSSANVKPDKKFNRRGYTCKTLPPSPRSLFEDYHRFYCGRCKAEYLVAEEDLDARPCPKCNWQYWLDPVEIDENIEMLFGGAF